ncbi:hypothetical protein PMAYCL1PPCAC_26780, partial [Pristionchus mayeri]
TGLLPLTRRSTNSVRCLLSLRCGVDHNRSWKCDAEVKMYLLRSDGTRYKFPPVIKYFANRSITFDPKKWSVITRLCLQIVRCLTS